MLAEFEDWHSHLKWMQQTFVWPQGFENQCGAEPSLSKYCILLQPHHITSYCLQSDRGISQLDIARHQRLLTAVSRISMHQRMQIVFMGYRGRFSEVGVCTQGESSMLTYKQILVVASTVIATEVSCPYVVGYSQTMQHDAYVAPCLQVTLLSWR